MRKTPRNVNGVISEYCSVGNVEMGFCNLLFMALGFMMVHGVMVCRLHCVLMSLTWFGLEVRIFQVLWATVLDMGR